MKQTIWKQAVYRAQADRLDAVVAAVERFVAAVREHEPTTFYRAWQTAEDPRSFFHVMGFVDDAAEQRHRGAPYTLELVDVLYPSCEEDPQFHDLRPIGEG